jgi:hypothetical protein
MKKTFYLLATGYWLLATVFISGCQETAKKEKIFESNGVIDGNIPAFLAGTWKAEDSAWEITISKNGEVISAILPLGEVEVKPNQKTIVEMQDGSKSVYTAGNFEVNYNPLNKELEVAIEMKNVHIVFVDNVIDGNSTEIFTGSVSEDGKIWETMLLEIFDYGQRFPQDSNAIGEQLRFRKEN